MLFHFKTRKLSIKPARGATSKATSMFLTLALTVGLIAAAPLTASASLPYELSRTGSDVTLTVDCNVPIDMYNKYNISVYQGDRLRMTSKAGTTCTNLTVRSADAPSTALATGIFAAPWPTSFTNIMLQQAPNNGSYTATVLSNAPIGKSSKNIAVSNAGTKGILFFVTVRGFDPTISSISPNSGATTGGQAITITGTNFATGATVTIGGVACTNVVVVSATSITCNVPAGTVGAKNVVVRNSDGLSVTSTGAFSYRLIATPSTKNATDFYANLNGTDTWLRSVANQGPIPAAGNFTLDFWVYDPSDRGNSLATILAQSGSDATQKLEIQVDKSGLLDQELNITYRGVDYRTLFKLPQDTWVHITLLSNASTPNVNNKIWLRIDGSQVFEVVTDTPVDAGKRINGPLFVGRAYDDANKQLFKGRVDQIKVWNDVIGNDSIVRSMHTWGAPGVQAGTALLAHYDFNDRTIAGGQVFNKSSNNNHLTLTAASGTTPFVDVKEIIPSAGKTTYRFPRSYLTEVGGWLLPNGVTALPEALIVAGGGGGALDGAGGGGGGGSQFGSVPTLSANESLGIRVGQGGNPSTSMFGAQSGQSSALSRTSATIAAANGGAGAGVDYASRTSAAAGGTAGSYTNFTAYTGGVGGRGPAPANASPNVAPATNTLAFSSGGAGTTRNTVFSYSSISFGGGGGGGVSADGNVTTALAHSSGGTGGGGKGAGTGARTGTDGLYACATARTYGLSTGFSGEPNTGGGGGGGAAYGDACVADPNNLYDGERTTGGHGGSGVIILGVASAVPAPVAPTYTVVATDNGTSEITANWSSMPNAATTRKIVQYRIDGGTWYQAIDSSNATSTALPRTFAGVIEFRVSQLDGASEQWGEWVYSNQLNVELYGGAALCANPMKLRYDISSQSVTMRFTNSLAPISIRWGDGTQTSPFSTSVTSPTAQQVKTYSRSGAYTIEVCGKFGSFTTTSTILLKSSTGASGMTTRALQTHQLDHWPLLL